MKGCKIKIKSCTQYGGGHYSSICHTPDILRQTRDRLETDRENVEERGRDKEREKERETGR